MYTEANDTNQDFQYRNSRLFPAFNYYKRGFGLAFSFPDESLNGDNQGFHALIELVIVILLLGILAAFAVPKWLGKGGFETHTLRDRELVVRLRLVQTMNMQGASRCTQLVIEATRSGHLTQPAPAPASPLRPGARMSGSGDGS